MEVWLGRGGRKNIRGIMNVFTDLGIPERVVEVINQEIPKTHWSLGGKPVSKARPDAKPR